MSNHRLPADLIRALWSGECVIFLGSDEGLGFDKGQGPPTRSELALALGERGPNSPDIATACSEIELAKGRATLLRRVCKVVSSAEVSIPDLYRLLAKLPVRFWITTTLGTGLTRALEEVGSRPYEIISEVDLQYVPKDRPVILRLHGAVSQPGSLILTQTDHDGLEVAAARVFRAARGWMAARPFVFIACDPADAQLRRLFLAATVGVSPHIRRSYMIAPSMSASASNFWQDLTRNTHVLKRKPLPFARSLIAALGAFKADYTSHDSRTVRGRRPYKFLDFYDEADSALFFGRSSETKALSRAVLSSSAAVLFGASGAGKTSIVKAGVIPYLKSEGYHCIYVRSLSSPEQALRHALLHSHHRRHEAVTKSRTTLRNAFLDRFRLEDRVIVIFDQFEEFLLQAPDELQSRFFARLAQCAEGRGPEIRFVFVLREDFLALLDIARRVFPYILSDSYRLGNLPPQGARSAIIEPANAVGLEVEDALVEAIITDLVDDRSVPPAQLSIVCDRVYETCLSGEVGDQSRLSLAGYERLGRSQAIMDRYLEDVLGDVPPDIVGSARAILKALVTSRSTKASLTKAKLNSEVHALGDSSTRADEALRVLVDARLIRSFERAEHQMYELAHDLMGATIASWMTEPERKSKVALELLERETQAWTELPRVLDREILSFLASHLPRNRALEPDQLYLLLRSALSAGVDTEYWIRQSRSQLSRIEDDLFLDLSSGDLPRVSQAARMIARLASRSAIGRLVAMVESDLDNPRGLSPGVSILDLRTPNQLLALGVLTAMDSKLAVSRLRRWTPRDMAIIPAGAFKMGSNVTSDEGPPHSLWLPTFWIDRLPITNAQWARFPKTGWPDDAMWTEEGRRWRDNSQAAPAGWSVRSKRERHPVVGISWYEAVAFARFSRKRLLSEAHWEKACRGPTGHMYPWGNKFDRSLCNTDEAGLDDTVQVGSYSPAGDSQYRVADLIGNVWEWTSSMYRPYPFIRGDGRDDLEAPGNRVARGGSYLAASTDARGPYRLRYQPSERFEYYGLRLGYFLTPFGDSVTFP